MSLDYRPMTLEDYDEMYVLWSQSPGVGITQADTKEGIALYLERNPGQSFVCVENKRVVGTILCGNDGRRAYIYHTAVAEGYKRQGIAARLVELAMERQTALGMDKCTLLIYHENEAGRAFWLSCGFEVREDAYAMSRML